MDFLKFFKSKPSSKDVAKSRLQFVLVQDRINCSPQLLELIKNDIIKVISNHMEIDEDELRIELGDPEHNGENGSSQMLYANIPIKRILKDRL